MAVTVKAPSGAEFKEKEMQDKNKVSLGIQPSLTWQSLDAARSFYGEAAVLASFNRGLKATLMVLTKRMIADKKTPDEIATAQVKVKPGQRMPSTGKAAKDAFTANLKSGAIKPEEALRISEGFAKLSPDERKQLLALLPA